MPTRVIGFYAHGCIAGAQGLPINGDTWQVMRLSRNRYWGHPQLVALVERLAAKAHKDGGWPGILVGDMSQPRGGPMTWGHGSHQNGLDVDIWFNMDKKPALAAAQREDVSLPSMVLADQSGIDRSRFGDPQVWTPAHVALLRAAAKDPQVARIFVNAAIKKALCREANGDRSWLSKVRPMYGHDYHFHIRMKCPGGSGECESQPAPSESEGCSAGDLAFWFKDSVIHPKPPTRPPKPKPPMTLAQLPAACKAVLNAPDAKQ
jgi:penicillin-insensitive murein endopeptidase